ncbi:MAG: metallophosphoesterase [Saprospiraceae bacterium]|nr:metallophosphoesterase [Saprospiraceae bacterium]
MSGRLIGAFILIALLAMLEIYTYSGLRSIAGSHRLGKYLMYLFYGQTILVFLAFLNLMNGMQTGQMVRSASMNIWLGIILTSVISKLVFSMVMFLQDGGRMVGGIYNYASAKLGNNDMDSYMPGRRQFINQAALALAGIPLISMFYGMAVGKYKYTVKRVQLAFKDLPKAFDGFKIVQISDIHSGSFDDIGAVRKGIELANAQDADLLLFTGDLVNSEKDEINPYVDVFKALTSKAGKYAVLGNHDYYGYYSVEESKKPAYWNDFMSKFETMGFTMLNNTHTYIEKDGERICLAGVENWGAGRHFPKHGDLKKALTGVGKEDFTILMSHDPSHWDHHVLPDDKHVHLTLSGHTHGMQFGIDMPGFKWSPVKYRYPRWMGLYEEAGQYLYVNRGFGFLAFPGRVGMWPEITVLELKSLS